MSVTASLHQISKIGLEIIQQDLATFESVIWLLVPKNSDMPLISDLSELTSEQRKILEEIAPDANDVCNVWTDWDIEVLEDLKRDFPQDYERLKMSLYSIVSSEKNCSYLDFGKAWDWVSYVLRGGRSMDASSYVSVDNVLRSVNIFSGKPVDSKAPKSGVLYQGIGEVAEMSQVLLEIDESEIRQRFEQASQVKPPIYGGGWSQDHYPTLRYYYQEVQLFYRVAADQGFGVVSNIS